MTNKIAGSYGDTLITGGMDRPQKSAAEFANEAARDRITHQQLLKRFEWSDADFDAARGYGFPPAIGYNLVGGPRQAIYSLTKIERWREALLAFATKAVR